MIRLNTLKVNPDNPRYIGEEKMKELTKSLKVFPAMMSLRPIVIDENNMILGGNMRYRALLELGYDKVPKDWIKKAFDLTAEEKKEFIIKDNVGFGQWDFDILANEWEPEVLTDWGLELPTDWFKEEEKKGGGDKTPCDACNGKGYIE